MTVGDKLKERLRELAQNWPEGDTNSVDRQCTGIERRIPPDCQHEDAIKALEYCKQARRFGPTEKGYRFLINAVAAMKDFELFDDSIKGVKFNQPGRGPGLFRKIIARLLKNNPEMKNPELWAAVANKPPKGWTAYDNRVGKYLEGKSASDSMGYGRFCNICGEERNKLKQ